MYPLRCDEHIVQHQYHKQDQDKYILYDQGESMSRKRRRRNKNQWRQIQNPLSKDGGEANLESSTIISDAPIPGSTTITEMKGGVSTGYYCNHHKSYIKPLFVRGEAKLIPICQECFLEELVKANRNLGTAAVIEAEDDDEIVAEQYPEEMLGV